MKRRCCVGGAAVALLMFVSALLALIMGCGLKGDPEADPSNPVSVSPSQLTLYPGEQNMPVTVGVSLPGLTEPVTITVSDLPSGVTATSVTLPPKPGSSAILELSASPSAGQEGFSPLSVSPNTSWTANASIVASGGETGVLASFPVTISLSNPSFAPAPSAINLPVLRIDTEGAPITSKTVDVPGTVTITSADGETTYLNDAATFHVHGNSTAMMPKLPYHMKLADSADLLSEMGLSCPYTGSSGKPVCDKSKSYILLANYDDKSLLRDWAASALANAIPYGNGYLAESPLPSGDTGPIPTPSGTSELMPWAPHSLFVELYLNGAYEGNYQLMEEIKVDSHRVNIHELAETDLSPDQVSGGYLMEIDQHQDESYVFKTPSGIPIGLIDPDFSPDPEVPEQTSYITDYVDRAENALFAGNYTDPALGWRAYFDEASAVNFYIVNDVMGNVDGGNFYSSDYLYKQQNDPYLYMGPVWDFDVSAGNVNYETIVDPTVPWMQVESPWYARWFNDPGFRADVTKQWNALEKNGVFTNWLASIRAEAGTLEQSQQNNFARWPILGIEVWPNSEAAGSYDGEVNFLINWLTRRIAYLNSVFNGGS